jgi:hypothetical protein
MELDDPEEVRRKGDWRRRALAKKWDVDTRTIDRMRLDGRLGDPAYYIGRIPVWTDEQRQAAERRTRRSDA